jgi:hypothetical protein
MIPWWQVKEVCARASPHYNHRFFFWVIIPHFRDVTHRGPQASPPLIVGITWGVVGKHGGANACSGVGIFATRGCGVLKEILGISIQGLGVFVVSCGILIVSLASP